MGAGNNAGMRIASGRYFLLLNSDAWMEPGAVERLVALADSRPDTAVVGPRLRNPDGSLQRSRPRVPEPVADRDRYFFLRKLAPGSGRSAPCTAPASITTRRSRSTGSRARACSCGARRPKRSGPSTRTTSCSARRPTGATGFARPAGR